MTPDLLLSPWVNILSMELWENLRFSFLRHHCQFGDHRSEKTWRSIAVVSYLASGCADKVFTPVTFSIFPEVFSFSHGAFPNGVKHDATKQHTSGWAPKNKSSVEEDLFYLFQNDAKHRSEHTNAFTYKFKANWNVLKDILPCFPFTWIRWKYVVFILTAISGF